MENTRLWGLRPSDCKGRRSTVRGSALRLADALPSQVFRPKDGRRRSRPLDGGFQPPAPGPTAKRLQGTPLNGSRLGLATGGRLRSGRFFPFYAGRNLPVGPFSVREDGRRRSRPGTPGVENPRLGGLRPSVLADAQQSQVFRPKDGRRRSRPL